MPDKKAEKRPSDKQKNKNPDRGVIVAGPDAHARERKGDTPTNKLSDHKKSKNGSVE